MSLTPNEKDLLAKKSDLEGILKPDANDILHLPDITISLAENQQGYTTSGLSKDGLVFAGAGTITGITSSEGVSTTLAASQSAVSAKQDKLIAGSNITIAQDGKTISATDTNEIEDLQDVDITNLANGQILKYNSTSQKWENGNEGGGGSSTLAGLSDVDITSPSAGQGLVYDATNQEWVNGNVSTSSSIDTLTDVNLTNLSNGQILKYNSTSQEWENANESGGGSTVTITPSLATGTKIADYSINGVSGALYAPNGGGGSSALSDLTDVTVTSPSDGQVLTYDNTSGKWVNDTPTASSSISTLTDVNLTSLSDGQILKYDATNQEWVNADESGGGGGTSKYTEEVLWSGNESTSRWAEPIVLNIDITDYDMLSIRCGASNDTGGVHIILTSEIPSGDSSGGVTVSLGTFTDSQYSIWLNKDNNILRIFTSTGVSINVKEVVGIKYGSGGGGGSGDSFITYTKTVTTTNYGWWTVEDKDGNVLDPDEYIIVDISVTPYYYDVLWSTYSDGGNHYFATLININDVYEVRSSTTYDWTITYAKKDFSGGGGAGAEEITLSDYNALTTAQKNDGTIRFIPESSVGVTTPINMSNPTNISESSKIVITPSEKSVEMTWDTSASNGIGATFYYSRIDITDYDYLVYDLVTGDSYDSLHPGGENPIRDLGIGLCSSAPSIWGYAPNINWTIWNRYEVTDTNKNLGTQTLDVSELSGEYYLVIAGVAWEATISNLKYATSGGNPSQIKYMDKTYADGTGGGSSVIPNPTGTPTDTLDTVSIDGTIYEIQGSGGGGSGSGYTETVLNDGAHSGDVYTLSDSISNYDMLEIEWIYNSSYYGTSITSVESFKTNATGILVDNTDNILFIMQYTSETTMTRTQSYGSLEVRQIKGLKFGGGGSSSHIYSTTEHKIGTWIDGSDVYEKTIDIINSSSVAATRDVSLSNDIPANARVIEAKGMYEYMYGNKKYGFPIGIQYVYGVLEDSEYLLRIVLGNGSLQSDEAIITVRYTKSS